VTTVEPDQLDTGPSSFAAGVKVYQDTNTTTGLDQGVIDFRTGMPGDAPARLALTSVQHIVPDPSFPDDPSLGQLVVEGSSFRISGGQTNGESAPELRFDVRALQQGGPYESVLALVGADRLEGFASEEVLYQPGGTYRGKYLASGIFGYDYLGPTVRPPTITRYANGRRVLSGALACDAVPVGGRTLVSLPAGDRPAKQEIFLCAGANNRVWRCDVYPSGAVTIAGAMSPDWSFVVGSGYLSLSGVAFHAAG
jgi:hypothetical protein